MPDFEALGLSADDVKLAYSADTSPSVPLEEALSASLSIGKSLI